ncbi:hypothetical protein PVAND_007483 [Polypedilum vanderplanki]|uniref:tRNA-splicing endonuclease subunit Sen34 n=1 Tax=Polypedilum vanderplanki TaxID=319348 RepID=A0A9J6C7B6_POLVA|nr:hypothetical protein PVAND_007483 [Polypedilum vanderplanki]
MESEKVKLVLINKKVMTFNVDDYIKLRKHYRIVGNLIGIVPAFPKNIHLSHLPAIYSEYEVRLMIEENIAIIEEKCDLSKKPTEQMRKDYEKHTEKIANDMFKPILDKKLKNVKLNMENIIKGKRKKLMKAGVPEEEINITEEDILKEEEKKLRQTINPNISLSEIPLEYPFHTTDVRIISEYHVTNEAKYKIFKDLWHKNMFITSAENFGGDFLTYTGDPNLFHASQIVHIVDPQKKFNHHFLSSCSRLALSVKKKCVFAYIDEENNEVVYQTIEWKNLKLRELYSSINDQTYQNQFESDDDDTEKEVEIGESSASAM